MEVFRVDLKALRTKEAVLELFTQLPGIPAYYGRNLDSLYEILSEWPSPLKLEIVIGGNPDEVGPVIGVLEDARVHNANLFCVVIAEHR